MIFLSKLRFNYLRKHSPSRFASGAKWPSWSENHFHLTVDPNRSYLALRVIAQMNGHVTRGSGLDFTNPHRKPIEGDVRWILLKIWCPYMKNEAYARVSQAEIAEKNWEYLGVRNYTIYKNVCFE